MGNRRWADMGAQPGGPEAVARIMNLLPAAEREAALAEIAEESEQTAEDIRRLMFVFEDLEGVPDKDFRLLLQEVDFGDLTIALRGVADGLMGKVERNMSSRKAEMLRDEMVASPPVRMSEVEAARNKVLRAAHELEKQGRIRLKNDPGEVWIE